MEANFLLFFNYAIRITYSIQDTQINSIWFW